MVCNLTLGKEKFAAVEDQVKEAVEQAEQVRRKLILLLQNDTTAYNGVIAAYKLPKETEEEKAARHAAVQKGLIDSTADVPLDICRAALRVCRLSRIAAEIGNPAAVTDAGCAALFGEAAAQGAALNGVINLGSIEDEAYRRIAADEVAAILYETADLRTEVLKTTRAKL